LLARTLSDFTRLALSLVGSRYSVLSTYSYLCFSDFARDYRQFTEGREFRANNHISTLVTQNQFNNVDIFIIYTYSKKGYIDKAVFFNVNKWLKLLNV